MHAEMAAIDKFAQPAEALEWKKNQNDYANKLINR